MKKILDKIMNYFLYFMMYAVIGWCYEVFLEIFIWKRGFTNRGVLFGPYCPVYGVGALAFIFTVYGLIKNKDNKKRLKMLPVIFLLCMLIATGIELVTSYILEALTGTWPWTTYVDYKINFQARIALSTSIRFGLGGCLFLYILQPLFEKLVNKMGNSKKIIFCIVLGLFLIDLICKVV